MDYPLCTKPPKHINFFINAIVHVFILLTIISAFFFVYVSQLARNKFHSQLGDIVNNNLEPALQNADKDQYIKKLLQNIGPNLKQAQKYYNRENDATSIENKWLMYTTIIIILGLVLSTIAILVVVKLFCHKIPFGAILKENIILFSLIGSVEVLFFLFIARKFVPTKPSLVMETVVNSLKTNFS